MFRYNGVLKFLDDLWFVDSVVGIYQMSTEQHANNPDFFEVGKVINFEIQIIKRHSKPFHHAFIVDFPYVLGNCIKCKEGKPVNKWGFHMDGWPEASSICMNRKYRPFIPDSLVDKMHLLNNSYLTLLHGRYMYLQSNHEPYISNNFVKGFFDLEDGELTVFDFGTHRYTVDGVNWHDIKI
jgi:hypothetical protein